MEGVPNAWGCTGAALGLSPTRGSLWAFSPMAPQVLGVTPGFPLCLWCFRHSLWRGVRQCIYYNNIWNYNHDNTILPTSHLTWFASYTIWARLIFFAKVLYFGGMNIDPLWFSRGFHTMNMESVSIQDGPYSKSTFYWKLWFVSQPM
jgi:hypothetical protein